MVCLPKKKEVEESYIWKHTMKLYFSKIGINSTTRSIYLGFN
jgi:hypothetical protein